MREKKQTVHWNRCVNVKCNKTTFIAIKNHCSKKGEKWAVYVENMTHWLTDCHNSQCVCACVQLLAPNVTCIYSNRLVPYGARTKEKDASVYL